VQTVAAIFAVSPSFVVKPQAWRQRGTVAAQPQDGDAARRRSSGTGLAVARWRPAPSIQVFEIKEALAVGGFWNSRT
jgi:hypothetical protein